MILNIGQTADKINDTVVQLQNTMESEAKEQITQSLNASIDHMAKRIFQLLLIAFGLLLAWHFLTKKRSCNKQETIA
jgi:hypothetical protein